MKSRVMQNAVGVGLILFIAVFAASCDSDDGNDWHRLVCEVQSVNSGVPLVSGYINYGSDGAPGGEDDYTPIDSIQVVFHARPYGATVTLPEDGAYSWFQIESYDLEWEDAPSPAVNLSDYNVIDGNIDIMVPAYEEGAGSVLVVGIDMKDTPWFANIYTGDLETFQVDANLTFYGHESGSTEIVEIPAGLRVHFIGAITDD